MKTRIFAPVKTIRGIFLDEDQEEGKIETDKAGEIRRDLGEDEEE